MALHRDIFWIGRQWAVTGHGMQLIDQRLQGAFDIEAARLWDDDLIESLRTKAWLKVEDFDKGLAVARTRQWQPQAGSTPAVAPPAPVIENPLPVPTEPSKQQSPELSMTTDGKARFARPWRVWMKRRT
jgi:hypothetical protein